MAGKSQVLPVDAWVRSLVTERKLKELVRDGLLRLRMSRGQLEWRVPPTSHREPAPLEGYVVSFIAFHERGLRKLLSHFMRALLHYYGVELHHLAPNSISQAAIFAVVCKGYLGMSPNGNCGYASSRWSISPRRQPREKYGGRCTPVAAPFKCARVEASSTSRRSSSRQIADVTTGGFICATMMIAYLSSPVGS
jgi:hypothetical protein